MGYHALAWASRATARHDGSPGLKPKLATWLKNVAKLAPDRGDPSTRDMRDHGGFPCESEFGPITKLGQQTMVSEFGTPKAFHKYAFRAALLSGWITPGWHVHAARLPVTGGDRRRAWNSRPRIVELNTARLKSAQDWSVAARLMSIIYNSVTPTVHKGEQVELADLADFVRSEVPLRFFASVDARDAVIDYVLGEGMWPARDCMVDFSDGRMLKVLTALASGLSVPEDFTAPFTPPPLKPGETSPAHEPAAEEQPELDFEVGRAQPAGDHGLVDDLATRRQQRETAAQEVWAEVDALASDDPDLTRAGEPADTVAVAEQPRRHTTALGLPIAAAAEAMTGEAMAGDDQAELITTPASQTAAMTEPEVPQAEQQRRESYGLRDQWVVECAQLGRPLVNAGPKTNVQRMILHFLTENRTGEEILSALRLVLHVEGRNSPPQWMMYNALQGTGVFANAARTAARTVGETAAPVVSPEARTKAQRIREQRERLRQARESSG